MKKKKKLSLLNVATDVLMWTGHTHRQGWQRW